MIGLTLLLTSACSRPTPNVPAENETQTGQTPFQNAGSAAADTDPRGTAAPKETSPPFQKAETIPAGTLVTVSLSAPVVAGSDSKEPFEAILDEPVTAEGKVLIPRGAVVSGRIESARISDEQPERGYVRLALDSVHADGQSVPVQTASLFARQVARHDPKSGTIRLEKGRRLTFRLSEPIYFVSQRAKTDQ